MVQEKTNVKKATLILLTRNEIEGITALYEKIPFDHFDEAFAVDPGSTDGTLEFFKQKGVRVVMQEKKGRGEAFRVAMKEAKNEILVFFSPDGNENPKDSVKLVECIEQGNDMAIASRFMEGSRADDEDESVAVRSFGNKAFTTAANILFGGKLTDSINGYRAIRKDAFSQISPDAEGFCIEYQMSIRAMKLKHKIAEIPTFEGDRIGGQSTAGTLPTGWKFIKLIGKELLNGKKFVPA